MATSLRFPALLFLLATACHSGAPGDTLPSEQTRARIENRNSVDVDIFVRRSDGRASRLGFVPPNETATFALPTSLTAGSPWIRFEARSPRSGEPVVSEQFPVKRGDEISWSVPLQ
jgi:hypothetical protein